MLYRVIFLVNRWLWNWIDWCLFHNQDEETVLIVIISGFLWFILKTFEKHPAYTFVFLILYAMCKCCLVFSSWTSQDKGSMQIDFFFVQVVYDRIQLNYVEPLIIYSIDSFITKQSSKVVSFESQILIWLIYFLFLHRP